MPNLDSKQTGARSRVIRRRTTHPLRFLLKRYAYLAVVALLIVFLCSTVWTLFQLRSLSETEFSPDIPVIKFSLTNFVPGLLGTEFTCCIYGGLGFLCALILFAHLFSRRQAMLVVSLPVSREEDFAQRTLCFALYALLPSLFCFLFTVAAIFAYGLSAICAWPKLLAQMGMLLAIECYGYALGALCCALTGQLWSAILGGAVLCVSVEGAVGLISMHAENFLYTLDLRSLMRSALRFSPAYALYKNFYRPGVVSALPGFLVIALFLALALWLYRIRRVERAESTLAFPVLEILLLVYLPLVGGLLLGMIFCASEGGEALTIGMSVFGALLTWALCELLFNMHLQGLLRRPALALVSPALLLAMFGALHADLLGYDSFLPASAPVSMTIDARRMTGSDLIVLKDPETLQSGMEWAEHMRDYAVKQRGFGAKRGISLTITYHLNGRNVQRSYTPLSGPREQVAIRAILDSEDYRDSMLDDSALSSLREALQKGTLAHMGAGGTIESLRFDDAHLDSLGLRSSDFSTALTRPEDFEKLMDAYELDVRQRTADDIQNGIVGTIYWYGLEGQTYLNRYVTLCKSDKNTLNLLFGDRAEALIRYAQLGFADNPNLLFYRMTREDNRIASLSKPLGADEVRRLLSSGVVLNYEARSHYASVPMLEDEYLAVLNKKEFEDMFGLSFEEDEAYGEWIMENKQEPLTTIPLKQ